MVTWRTLNFRLSRLSKLLGLVAAIITGASTILVAFWSLYQYGNAAYESTRAARISQLTTFKTFGEVIKQYRSVETTTDAFMRMHRKTVWDCDQLLSKYDTGSSIYHSAEFKDFADTIRFFEELGTLIRFDTVDFDLAFEVITFPTDFAQKTRPLSECISANWFGKGQALPDFSFNMNELERNYDNRRNHQPTKWIKP